MWNFLRLAFELEINSKYKLLITWTSFKKFRHASYLPIAISNCLSIPVLSTTFVNIQNRENTDLTNYQAIRQVPLSNLMNEACCDTLYSTSEMINRILETMADHFLQYKKTLDDLYTCLERYKKSEGNRLLIADIEDAVIDARSRVRNAELKYLESITLTEHVQKLAKAMIELCFLIGEENLAVEVGEKLDYVDESKEANRVDINEIKMKLYDLECSLIEKSVIPFVDKNDIHSFSSQDKNDITVSTNESQTSARLS